MKSGNMYFIIFPKYNASIVMKKEIRNITIFPNFEIDVFLIPYVRPIPKRIYAARNSK